MKAFLLAAGEGQRLRPLTERVPKCLLPVGGVPLLEIWIALLARHGISDVLVNLHYGHEQVRQFLSTVDAPPRIHAVYEPILLGSAGTVLANRGFAEADESFLVAYADNLTRIDLTKMIAFHRTHDAALTMGVAPTDKPWEKGTVVLDANQRVVAFEEKAERPRSNLANVGIYVARQQLFAYIPDSPSAGDVVDFGRHVLPEMVPNIVAHHVDELLIDIGTHENYATAQRLWTAAPVGDRPAGS